MIGRQVLGVSCRRASHAQSIFRTRGIVPANHYGTNTVVRLSDPRQRHHANKVADGSSGFDALALVTGDRPNWVA